MIKKEKLKNQTTNDRISVSAEAYGRFNEKQDFVPKVVSKSQEVY